MTSLISPRDLITSFSRNPHLPLISIKCHPYHFNDSAVIVGDAAHAMVPFYGQGMNTGLEDVRVLFSILDKYIIPSGYKNLGKNNNESLEEVADQRAQAIAEYSEIRSVDAHAINELALRNYIEMRASVTSPSYKLRKWLEEKLSVYVPRLGWQTQYSRVSFGDERYSEVIKKSERQGKLLIMGLLGALSCPIIVGGLVFWQNLRNKPARGLFSWTRP